MFIHLSWKGRCEIVVSLTKYNPKVIVNLENGLYLFDNKSSTGKTRLFKCLRDNQKYGESVASYSYDDYLLGVPIEKVLVPNKYKVIMLDRYDMYNGTGKDLILSCSSNTIILLDCKKGLNFGVDYEICYLDMMDKSIEVTL